MHRSKLERRGARTERAKPNRGRRRKRPTIVGESRFQHDFCKARMEILWVPSCFHPIPLVKPVALFPSSTAVALLADTIR
ncbi:hypothetical protein PVAP13_7KG389601 [Panicum virgatum]|uniref:Uncharacterized protein n=1 Tax=Panicum virgatum TaxID=38727 RepID=A0A8T0QQT9_PANVG|nr:hypothetical protein PVAP13_7KG389601 [Panicum virgatum]